MNFSLSEISERTLYKLLALLSVVVVLLFSGVYWQHLKEVKAFEERKESVQAVEQNLKQLAALFKEWDVTYKVAISTPRLAVSNSILQLQNIRQRVENQPARGCASSVRLSMQTSMGYTIDALVEWMGGSNYSFEKESEKAAVFWQQLEKDTISCRQEIESRKAAI